VVIAIIGILASVVLASLNTARRKSRDARRIADVKQIQLALELYFDANQGYPPGTSLAPLATQNFIPVVPRDPSSLTLIYNYQATDVNMSSNCSSGNCLGYHLGTTLSEITNPALVNDADNTRGFSGLSAATEGTTCSTTGGTAQPGGTETCYDLTP